MKGSAGKRPAGRSARPKEKDRVTEPDTTSYAKPGRWNRDDGHKYSYLYLYLHGKYSFHSG